MLLSGIFVILLSYAFSENEVNSILDEIHNEYQNFEIGEQRQFVLVLGTTGTGKSTLASLLTGANLTSFVSNRVFSITDNNDLISENSTTVSKTKVPNLMIDEDTNTTFYDCAGFADSRGVVIDFLATRSIRDLLIFSNEIKLLFAVSYESIQNDVIGNRRGFSDLAKHIVNLIKNIEKYRIGMSLVVTKVPNLVVYDEEAKPVLIDDKIIIESIGDFINETKNDLENKRANTLTLEERRLTEGTIKLCEILLERESNEYTRINIFRSVNRGGSLKTMKAIQNERKAISTTIHDTMAYVQTDINDFGYSISDQSTGQLSNLIIKLEDKLEEYTGNICTDLKSFYQKGTPLINIINSTINFFQLPSNREFITRFNQSVINLGIEINANVLTNTSNDIDFLDFLQNIHNVQNASISKKIRNCLTLCAT